MQGHKPIGDIVNMEEIASSEDFLTWDKNLASAKDIGAKGRQSGNLPTDGPHDAYDGEGRLCPHALITA